MRSSDNINIGAADVYFEPAIGPYAGTEHHLGLTQDGANIKYTINWHEIKSDQYGENLMDAVLTGEDFSCDVNLMESTKDKIALVVSTATAISGPDGVGAVTFGRKIGLRASRVCGKLRFHPVSMGQNDKALDVIVYLAFNQEGLDLAFKKDKEWIIPCKWRALIDESRPDGDNLFRIGSDGGGSIGPDERIPIEFTIAPLNNSTVLGSNVNFTANAVFEDYSTGDVTANTSWKSSNTAVATVSVVGGKAVAAPKGTGTTIITGTYLGYSQSTSLTVASV